MMFCSCNPRLQLISHDCAAAVLFEFSVTRMKKKKKALIFCIQDWPCYKSKSNAVIYLTHDAEWCEMSLSLTDHTKQLPDFFDIFFFGFSFVSGAFQTS